MNGKGLYLLLILLLLLPFGLKSQENGMHLIKKPEWDKVLQLAKDEGKLIFVDCGASWCIPCKKFASEVLTNVGVVQFFNKHFINVYIDLEKDERPQVNLLPWLGSVPTLLFIDPHQGKVIHVKIGALDAEALLVLAKQVVDRQDLVDNWREEMKKEPFSGRRLLLYIEKLKETGYAHEAKQYISQYLNSLSVDSLRFEGNWKFCENELNDMLAPLFSQVWDNRKELVSLYGTDRVMKKLYTVIDNRLFYELDWRYKPEQFNDTDFEKIATFLFSVHGEHQDYYQLSVKAELAVRKEKYKNVLFVLQKVWKSSISEDRKKMLTQNFLRKIAYNGSKDQIGMCIDFIEKIVKGYGSAGTKGELLYLESEFWKLLGDEAKAKTVEKQGILLINPNYKF